MPSPVTIPNVSLDSLDEEINFFKDSGARVDVTETNGSFTLLVTFPDAAPPPAGGVQPPEQPGAPNQMGYVLSVKRIRTELRDGMAFKRTVGSYQAYFNNVPIPGIQGMVAERQGPGNNAAAGVDRHARIAAGKYRLSTHAGAKGKYRTFGYADPGGLPNRPWPAIRVEDTGAREGILIHCANGYLMSIGCINPSSNLANADSSLKFDDSKSRVISIIRSMKDKLGDAFPHENNVEIPNAVLIIDGEP